MQKRTRVSGVGSFPDFGPIEDSIVAKMPAVALNRGYQKRLHIWPVLIVLMMMIPHQHIRLHTDAVLFFRREVARSSVVDFQRILVTAGVMDWKLIYAGRLGDKVIHGIAWRSIVDGIGVRRIVVGIRNWDCSVFDAVEMAVAGHIGIDSGSAREFATNEGQDSQVKRSTVSIKIACIRFRA